jgi:hypothetical protein
LASSDLPSYRIINTPARPFRQISMPIPPLLHQALEGKTVLPLRMGTGPGPGQRAGPAGCARDVNCMQAGG